MKAKDLFGAKDTKEIKAAKDLDISDDELFDLEEGETREIKFRGYLKNETKILPVGWLNSSDADVYDIGLSTCGDLKCVTCTRFYSLDEVEIMQYTGIKDAKGNDIYEGDIVQALYSTDCQSRFKGKVIFNDGAFLLEDDKGMVELLYNLKEYCTLEVVGNAYEEGNGGQNND